MLTLRVSMAPEAIVSVRLFGGREGSRRIVSLAVLVSIRRSGSLSRTLAHLVPQASVHDVEGRESRIAEWFSSTHDILRIGALRAR